MFGQSITDQFRYFEQQDATVTDWMKAEGRYARSVLDALPQHGAILAKLSGMTGSMGRRSVDHARRSAHLL